MSKGLRSNAAHTRYRQKRLNCWAMSYFTHMGRVSTIALTALVLASGTAFAQTQQGNQDNRTALKPDAPGLAHTIASF